MASSSPSHSHDRGQACAVGQGDDHHLTNPIPSPRQPLTHDVFSHPPVPSWKRGRLHGPHLPPPPLLPPLRLSPRESIVGFDHAFLQGEIDSKSPIAPSQLEAQSLPNPSRAPHNSNTQTPGPSDDGGDSNKLASDTPYNPSHASDEPMMFEMDEYEEIEQQPSLSPPMHPPLTRKYSEETLVDWPSAR